MKSLGAYSIWLTGSRKTVKRVVYEENGKFFINWYKQKIEVVRSGSGYATVEPY